MPGGHQRLTESADEKGAATSPKNRQLPPRRKARKQCEFPRAFTCSHPANGPQPPPLRYARRRLVPCGHAPALAARKKAARPVRPRTRPCRRQEGGSSCAATHPPLRHARRRLVPSGHGPARPARPRTGLSCPVTDPDGWAAYRPPDGWAAYRPPGACGCPPCFFVGCAV